MKKPSVTMLCGSILLLVVIGTAMLFFSWLKWPDVLIDFGMSLYIPWQLSEGSVLYCDIAWFFGPVSHYFNSWIFGIFGTSLMSLAWTNIVLAAVLAALIYRFFLKTADIFSATASTAAFITMFAFSQYAGEIANWNWVCPYTPEVPHGIILSVCAICAFSRYLKGRNCGLWLFITGTAGGVAALTKSEVFLALLPALAAGIIVQHFVCRRNDALEADAGGGQAATDGVDHANSIEEIESEAPWQTRSTVRNTALLLLGMILPVLGFTVYFARYMPINKAISSMALPFSYLFSPSVTSNIFFRRVQGMDQPLRNTALMLKCFIIYAGVVLVLWGLGSVMRSIRKPAGTVAWFIVSLAGLLCATPWIIGNIAWLETARGLPLAVLGLAVYFGLRALGQHRDEEQSNRALSLMVMAVFAFLLMGKILLNTIVYRYGFALAMPGVLLAVTALVYLVPARLGGTPAATGYLRTLGLVLAAAVMLGHVRLAHTLYQVKTLPGGEKPDTFMAFRSEVSSRGAEVNKTLQIIKQYIDPSATVVVLPEGVMLNYLARRKTSVPYVNFMPTEFAIFGEQTILEDFKSNPPDYVIYAHKESFEWGYTYFGRDGYGELLYEWVDENYQSVWQTATAPFTDRGFGILIRRHQEDDEDPENQE